MRNGGTNLFDYPDPDKGEKYITVIQLNEMFLDALNALKYIISSNISDMSRKCDYYMEDSFWEELTLKILAERLDISMHFLDKILNEEYKILLPREIKE